MQNLAVSLEITRKIMGLAGAQFRETVSSGRKFWRFSPQRRPGLTASDSQPAETAGRRPTPPALSARRRYAEPRTRAFQFLRLCADRRA